MRFSLPLAVIILCGFFNGDANGGTPMSDIKGNEAMLITFNDAEAISAWRKINDGVMGGLSRGSLGLKKNYGLYTHHQSNCLFL